MGKFINCGQTCIAPDYVLVERHVRDEVVSKLKEASLEMLGEGAEAAKKMTRLINPEAQSYESDEYQHKGHAISTYIRYLHIQKIYISRLSLYHVMYSYVVL